MVRELRAPPRGIVVELEFLPVEDARDSGRL